MPGGLTALLAAVPQQGHITPMLGVAAALVAEGVHVVVLTGERYRDAVEAAGARFTAVDPRFDLDDRTLETAFPGLAERSGIASMKAGMRQVFLPPLASQLVDVHRAANEFDADVVVTDPLFLGGIAYALQPRERRLPVAVVGFVPLLLESRDTAPFGLALPPLRGPLNRPRNALLRAVVHRFVLADVEREADRAFRAAVGVGLGRSALAAEAAGELLLQLTVPSFEYPRRDLPSSVRFVGPLPPPPGPVPPLPGWWGDLDGRTVVHVTQGTVATAHLEDLLVPTARALAREDVLVVAATGRRDPQDLLAALGSPPGNLRVAAMLPYEQLLPRIAAMVTNGGYGGVHAALRHGVPLVVAGDTEEKAEVNARVAWSGAGVDLRTRRPGPERIRAAVRQVLTEPQHRAAAGRLAADLAAAGGAPEVAALLRGLVDAG